MKNTIFKTALAALLIVMIIPILHAQESIDPAYLKENLPASPEAAGLGTYGDIATNPYNGKVNISIPIHQINLQGLSIPIQLSYDSGGIRVNSEAGWVGMNWSLSANAAITRSIFGNDDLNENEIVNHLGDISAFPFNNHTEVVDPEVNVAHVSLEDVIEMQQSFNSSEHPHSNGDMQPDIFDVSLFGKSYKFQFNKRIGTSNTLTTHIFNNHHATITYDLVAQTFTVIDDRGFTFVFATKDYAASMSSTRSSNANQGSSSIKEDTIDGLTDDLNQTENTAITSWLLDTITAPTGEQTTFTYIEGAHFTYPQYSGRVRFRDRLVFSEADEIGENYNQNDTQYTASMSLIHSNYLQSISGDFGEVVFNSIEDRRDLMTANDLHLNFPDTFANGGFTIFTKTYRNPDQINRLDSRHGTPSNPHYEPMARKLTSIDINDYNNQTVRAVVFDHSYYSTNKLGQDDEAKYLRLKLDGLTIEDKTYSFTYETPNGLPSKISFDTDFWGFYNGANNTSNVPSIGRFCTSPISIADTESASIEPQQIYFNLDGADRGANFLHSNRGNLIKITYPTGGYSTFEYEGNRAVVDGPAPYIVTESFEDSGSLRWTNLIDEDQYKFTYLYLKNAEDPNWNFFDYRFIPGTTAEAVPIDVNDVINLDEPTLVSGQGALYFISGLGNFEQYYDVPKYYLEEINNPSNISTLFYFGDWADGFPGMTIEESPIGNSTVVLPSGDYRLKREINFEEGVPTVALLPEDFSIIENVFDGELPSDIIGEFPIGGSRIKTITNSDNNGAFINKKQFDYTIQGTNSGDLSSSGKLMDDIIHHSRGVGLRSYTPTFWIEGRPSNSGSNDNNFGASITSNSTLKQSPNAQGSHIGYSFVREYALDKDDIILSIMDRTYFNESNRHFKDNYHHLFYWNPTYPAGALRYTQANNVIVLGMDPKLSFGYVNGNVLTEAYYDCSETLVREVNTEYETLVVNPNDNYYATFAGWGYVAPNGGESENPFMTDDISYITYKQPPSYSRIAVPSYTQTIDYLSNGQVYTDQYFTYDDTNQNMVETESIVRDGESTVTKYYYPYDSEVASVAGVSNLLAENQLSQIVKSEAFYNDQKMGTTLLNFADNNSTGNNVRVTATKTAKGTDNLEARMQYEQYDYDGNVLQSRQEDGSPMSYIWGYNNEHVIAKVDNMTYNDLAALTTIVSLHTLSDNDTSSCLGNGNCNEQNLRNALNALRTALPDTALMTSYTYNPLVGVTSITDPRGTTIYYTYDSFDRLDAVYDQNYKLLSKNEYNITDDLVNTLGEDALGVTECGSTVDDDTSDDGGGGPFDDNDAGITTPGSRMADNTMIKDGISYPNLSNSIDLIDSQTSSTVTSLSYQAFPYGGSGNLMYRWKRKGDVFSDYSSSPNWTTSYDCSQDTAGIEVICEVKDMELGITNRTRLTHQVLCNN